MVFPFRTWTAVTALLIGLMAGIALSHPDHQQQPWSGYSPIPSLPIPQGPGN